VGDILTPDPSGLCRKAANDDKVLMAINAIPRPKITAIFPNHKEYVAAFLT
jgi:hypothetical protein